MQTEMAVSNPLKHTHPPDIGEVAKQRQAPNPRIAANVARLMEQQKLSQSALAERSSVGQSTISRLLMGDDSPTSRTLEKLASAFGVAVEEFFRVISVNPDIHPDTHNVRFESAGVIPAALRVSVAGTAKLGENGHYEVVTPMGGGVGGHVEVSTTDRSAYALRVRGDALHPAIRDGWIIVAEPQARLSAGEYVLVAMRDGRRLLKELLYERKDSIAVVSVSGDVRLTIPREDIESAHAVTAVLPPSKLQD